MRNIDMNQSVAKLLELATDIASQALGRENICPSCQGDRTWSVPCELCGGGGSVDHLAGGEDVTEYTIIGLLAAIEYEARTSAPERPKRKQPAPILIIDNNHRAYGSIPLRPLPPELTEAGIMAALRNAEHTANIDDAVTDGDLTTAEATRQLTDAVRDEQ